MRFHPLVSLLALGAAAATHATYITGVALDSEGQPLTGVAVNLYSLPDSVMKSGTATDIDGRYVLEADSGRYMLLMQMLGTLPAQQTIDVEQGTDTLQVTPVTLTDNALTLQEVVVKGVKTAVTARMDTLEYNADSYHTHVNSTVEDLLKRLPGVEVASDGTITSGGKSVTKILVDGKEFFADDPKAATKNLPSDMVDKVQVIDRKSDLARLTGVDDGEEETVINLSVKKNMRNGWFGNVQAGYGTDQRYQYSFNINRFQNGNQITLLGGGNNINEMGFTDRGRGRFSALGGNSGINSTQHLGVNFNVGRGEELRVGGNVIYSHSDRKTTSLSNTQYLFPDSTSTQQSWSKSRDRGHNVNVDLRLQWKMDEANTLDFRPRFSYSQRDQLKNDSSILRAGNATLSPVNHSENDRRIKGKAYEASGNLIFNHNFLSHPGRSASAQVRYSFSDNHQYENTYSRLLYYMLDDDEENLFRYIDTHTWASTVDARLTWTEPIGNAAKGNFLTAAYRIDWRRNNADKLTYPLEPDLFPGTIPVPDSQAPDGAQADASLSNRFRNTFFTQEIQLGYKHVSRPFNLEAGVLASPSTSKSTDLINDARSIPARHVWNFAPFMRLRLRFSETSSLSAHYRASTSQPSMSQLQPVADISDPLNITIGNPDLKPSFTQTLMARYNNFQADRQRSIMAMMHARYTSNNIARKTTTDPETGVRTTTYSNVNGDWQLMGMAMLTQPLHNLAWRINGRLNTQYSSTAGFIDGQHNRAGNFLLSPSAGVTFTADICQLTLGPSYSLQLTTATLASQPRRTIHSAGFDADASLFLPFGLELNTTLNMSHSTGYAAGYDNTQWLWNARLSYSLLRDKSLTLSLSVYDILQEKRNVSRSVTAATITDSRINDLTRYAMFSVAWKFNSFGSAKNIPKVDGDPGDRPGPPPGVQTRGGMPGGAPMGPPPGRMP